ncbi:MAG: hypothetical protein ACK501_15960 [Planctomycetota bacterium]|jgi:hypothetical protein
MTGHKELEAVRKALRHQLREGISEVAVPAAELRLLLDQLGRLQQSNDRLRRQNRRVRLKLQRAGLADDEAAADGDAGDGPQSA